MKRVYLFGLATAVLLALLPTAARASTTYTESIAGIETAIPTACGVANSGDSLSPFAGVALGTLNGAFAAAICHTPLPNATIVPGGVFKLTNTFVTVSGGFAGGTVRQIGPTQVFLFTCVQKYAVVGALTPAGSFMVQLKHYGTWDGRTCHVHFATVTGTATLTV
jgi:hypothetical protein